jgi:cystathionine beta-lyase/cystathionine gamma-synthase
VSKKSSQFQTLATQVVHAGAHEPIEGAVVTPIFQSANYLMRGETRYQDLRYIRLHNSPNHEVLQARLAVLEGGEAALVTASGMAAISGAILSFAKSGEHMLIQRTVYGGTQSFLDHDGAGFGLQHTSVDFTDPAGPEAWARALRPETRLLYAETISNPLIEVSNLRAVAEFARQHGLISVIDNTFASPVNCKPLELGFDLVVHSATKYLNGHSDLVAGVVVGSAEQVEKVRHLQLHLGAALDPHTCFLLERGLKTLALRVERQNQNAQCLAEYLEGRAEVCRVHYPGLPSNPGHRWAKDLFQGYGGMVSFELDQATRVERFLKKLQIPLHAASLGGVESLVVQPSRSTHMALTQEEREAQGITDELVRVSVGIEDGDELIADFAQALDGS